MNNCKPIPILMHPSIGLSKDEIGKSIDQMIYRGMIRFLLYLTASRPDILFSVCLWAKFQSDPQRVSFESCEMNIHIYCKFY
uniref:Retrovirus-related Pol polyprotein from transposon TNT 1-94 n=1 Tax=Cajanus cajan TaxID=3821 RepID=A0A151T607_CAJCA|nr:hypothetical protein KK1_017001 [Cajanus cajan]